MPRNETILNIFVASPSDVEEERKALESIVFELNKTWSKSLNLRLDLIKWETDVYPGIGRDAQDVINSQINDEYDIFIAIIWSKIGTPTKNADSGTVEELEKALSKYKEDSNSVDVMVYFKDQALPPSKMDFLQLQKIQELKDNLKCKGTLYWTFDSTDDFESQLRVHLSKVAQKWSKKFLNKNAEQTIETTKAGIENEIKIEEPIDDDNDYGLLDYLEIYEERMLDLTGAYEDISAATERVGKQFNIRTEEINSLMAHENQPDVKKRKKVVKFASDDMERYAKIINEKIKISKKSRTDAFEALSKALSFHVDLAGEDDIENICELEKGLIGMKEALKVTNDAISSFQKVVSELPELTMHINKSKRKVKKGLDEVIEEIKSTINSSQNILDVIEDLKSRKQI